MIPNTRITRMEQGECFLTTQENRILQFIIVITEVSKMVWVSLSGLVVCKLFRLTLICIW